MVDPGLVRAEWPRVLGALVRYCGDAERAEDALQDALSRLVERDERPANLGAWLTTTARRILVDEARRDRAFAERMPRLLPEDAPASDALELHLGDDRLALVFVACSPELTSETRLALSLRFALGLPTSAIADALLVQPTAMSARLTRAKRAVATSGLPAPEAAELDERVPDVRSTIHVLYTLGHTLPQGSTVSDAGLTGTAIELARALLAARPDDPENAGLLALLLFTEARAPGRRDAAVDLERADRRSWDRSAIAEATDLAVPALGGRGRFGFEAGIAGLHSTARSWDDTDWPAIATLYDRLVERWPSPSARLARLVARSHLPGELAAALDAVAEVDGASPRQIAAVRADLLRRLGRGIEARAAYRVAATLEGNDIVREFLRERADTLDDGISTGTEE